MSAQNERDESALLNTAEAAGELRLHPQTLVNWRSAGEGPAYVRVGRSIRYRLGDLRAWIRLQTVGGAAMIAVNERRAAELLDLSPDTLRRYRRAGTGPVYTRVGGPNGPIRYRVADLDAWLETSRYQSRAEELARGGAR